MQVKATINMKYIFFGGLIRHNTIQMCIPSITIYLFVERILYMSIRSVGKELSYWE